MSCSIASLLYLIIVFEVYQIMQNVPLVLEPKNIIGLKSKVFSQYFSVGLNQYSCYILKDKWLNVIYYNDKNVL